MSERVLSGLNVVGFVTTGVGPMILRSLAGNGANVIRVESIKNPDLTRTGSPFKDDVPGVNRSYFFTHTNPGSLSLTLNMKHPSSGSVAQRLVSWADVIVENWRPGVMESWNLGYQELKARKDDIIMLSTSQMGGTGPHKKISGVGGNLAAMAGFVTPTGWPDRAPVAVGPYPDYITPPFAIASILAALDYRRKTGKGQHIDISQYENSIQYLIPTMLDYTVNKRVPSRIGNQCSYAAPHGVYRCKGDDRWCAIAVFTDDEWEAFKRVVGNPPWIMEKKFGTFAERKRNEERLNSHIEEWTINFTPEEVMERMQASGVEAGVVRDIGDVVDKCPQTNYRHYFSRLKHPEMGDTVVAGNSYILSKTPYYFDRPAPCLGEHNEYICTSLLGLSDEEFIELLKEGALE